jgi:chromosomal replication initiation ATPase DnaA
MTTHPILILTNPRMAAALAIVEELTDYTADDLRGTRRNPRLSNARQALWLALRTATNAPYVELGERCNRVYTAIHYGVQCARLREQRDSAFAAKVAAIVEAVRQA